MGYLIYSGLGILVGFFLRWYGDHMRDRILIEKAKNKETEFIKGYPIVPVHETDYMELIAKARFYDKVEELVEDIIVIEWNNTQLKHMITDMNEDAVFIDGFDDALIGYVERLGTIVALYDTDKCIDIIRSEQGMEIDDAINHFRFKVASMYMGENTPAFATIGDRLKQ